MLFRRYGFVTGFLLVSAFKLWLVHTDEIYGSATEYDALWFVNAAKHWYWGAEYSWTAFVRPPAYALFIAVIHLLAFPLRIAIELLQMAGYLTLIVGLRKAGLPRLICLACYAVMILHPASQFNRCTMADTFYTGILPLALGGLLLTLFTAKLTHAAWTGIALALLWNTREESFLIPPLLIVFLGLVVIRQRLVANSWSVAVRQSLKPAGVLLGTVLLLNLTVDTANYHTFGSFSKSDMSSASYEAAFKALLRIKPSKGQRFIPVSTEALKIAYEVSPTFAQLKPQLEGDLGRAWQVPTFAALGIHESGPWFMWAFRDAARAEGLHKTPEIANRFYRKVAEEINRACDEGRIPSRKVLAGFLDPGAIANICYMGPSLLRNAGLFVLPYQKIADREDDILTKSQRALYDEMANRRERYRRVGTLRMEGMAFVFGDPVMTVAYKNSAGEVEASTDHLSDGPEIVERFASEGQAPLRNRFYLSVDLFRTDGLKGDFVFTTQSGAEFREKAANVLNGNASVNDGQLLKCQVVSRESNIPPPSLSDAFVNFIGSNYRFLTMALSATGLVALLIIMWCYRQLKADDPLNAALILVGVAILLRVLLFTFLDATWWEGGYERYLFPVMPLYSCFLILVISQSLVLWRRARQVT